MLAAARYGNVLATTQTGCTGSSHCFVDATKEHERERWVEQALNEIALTFGDDPDEVQCVALNDPYESFPLDEADLIEGNSKSADAGEAPVRKNVASLAAICTTNQPFLEEVQLCAQKDSIVRKRLAQQSNQRQKKQKSRQQEMRWQRWQRIEQVAMSSQDRDVDEHGMWAFQPGRSRLHW